MTQHSDSACRWRSWALALPILGLVTAAPALAQTPATPKPRPTGRISFYANGSTFSGEDVPRTSVGEFITSITFQTPDAEGDGLEYGIDLRQASYTRVQSTSRVSIYDGYVGVKLMGGQARVRGGQMWLSDLGGLGSLAGGLAEYRGPSNGPLGRLRVGGFAGYEPELYTLGVVEHVRKMGAYAALDGSGGRRHIAGYVRLTNGGLTERSVVTFTNFLPVKSRVFVYQAGEYDVAGPANQGTGGLTYFFINGRAQATSRVDVQANYHRGRSIDARSITDDVLNGRPLPAGALEGLLYESVGGRLTVQITQAIRAYGGYARDKNNRDSQSTGRLTFGAYASRLGATGLDLTVSGSRTTRPGGEYDAVFLSVGRQLGRAIYLSGDYSTSVAIARFTAGTGVVVETRPKTQQFNVTGIISAGRQVSILGTVEYTQDDTMSEIRVISGLTYRIR